MKFIQVTGYGNNTQHLISIKSIADITFESQFTQISLTNGKSVNVVEDKEAITDLIRYQNGDIISKGHLDNLQAQIDAYDEMGEDMYANDYLPF
jgi:predicted phosphodiesterase